MKHVFFAAVASLVVIGAVHAASDNSSNNTNASFWSDAPRMNISEVRRGAFVKLTGIVDRMLDEDEFRLRDETGAIEIYMGPNFIPIQPGQKVTVTGFVDDDFTREVYARTIEFGDGRTAQFSYNYD